MMITRGKPNGQSRGTSVSFSNSRLADPGSNLVSEANYSD
jgi:hypothetical protein